MELHMGKKIAALRRAKGLTQEQLAEQLGVSAPAVSKWETDTSYPDITMLCPLARALDASLDELLRFEQTLSDRQVAEKMNAVLENALHTGAQQAEEQLKELLRQYPNCIALLYNAAIAYDSFRMFFMAADPQAHQRWKEEKKRLLQRIHASGSPAYCQAAAVQLAALAIEDGQLERAARLLDELPPLTTDPTFARVQLHLKQNEPQKALETAQKRLYVLVEQVQNLLMLLQSKEMLPDVQRRFAVWQVQKELMRLFFDHSGMSDACGIDLLLEQGRTEEAAAALAQFVQAMAGPAPCPKAFLFTPGLRPKEGQPVTKEMAALLLRTLPQEEKYAALLQHPACKAALEQLRAFAAQDD